MTIILGSIGANKKAKRAALSYLMFNIIGAVFFSAVIYGVYYTVGIKGFSAVVNRGDIANIHLAFNLFTSIMLLPFSNQMASLTGKILKDSDESYGDEEIRRLDDMLLKTPGIALKQCKRLMSSMGKKIMENYNISMGLLTEYDKNAFNTLNDNEGFIDRCETALSAYVVRIDRDRLTPDNRLMAQEILNCIGDYERIGDYSINIGYIAQECHENKVKFSKKGRKELNSMLEATKNLISMTLESFDGDKLSEAVRIEPLGKAIRRLKDESEKNHVERLQDGDCGVNGGVALYDLINCFEKIALHARSISRHIVKRLGDDKNMDEMHGHVMDKHSEEYKAMINYYYYKYRD